MRHWSAGHCSRCQWLIVVILHGDETTGARSAVFEIVRAAIGVADAAAGAVFAHGEDVAAGAVDAFEIVAGDCATAKADAGDEAADARGGSYAAELRIVAGEDVRRSADD